MSAAMPIIVREGLFIGDIVCAADVLENGASEITHVLSLFSSVSISFFSQWRTSLSIPVKKIRDVYEHNSEMENSDCSRGKLIYSLEYAGKELKIIRMAVPLRDMENENLLDYLDVCFDFIHKGRKEGAVLVHCFAGVSRSASVMTAYLMKTEQLPLEDALRSLQESSESICPNDGFMEQLKMFEEMGFQVDRSSSIYKRFNLKMLGYLYNRGKGIENSKFAADPGTSSDVGVLYNGNVMNTFPLYRCKKCRRIVALQDHVVDHIPSEDGSSFQWKHKQRSGNPFGNSNDMECSSIFVEPLKWMTPAGISWHSQPLGSNLSGIVRHVHGPVPVPTVKEGEVEGKLSCVNCGGRLGSFNWAGIMCSCGSWIAPAFQLHRSKVDVSTI